MVVQVCPMRGLHSLEEKTPAAAKTCTRARATARTLALAVAAPGLDGGRPLAAGGVVLRARRRGPAAPLRPAGRAGRDPRAHRRPRARDRAHRSVARARRAEPGRAARGA